MKEIVAGSQNRHHKPGMKSRKRNVAKDNLPTYSSLTHTQIEAKTNRRQVILGCIKLYDPPCKAVMVEQKLRQGDVEEDRAGKRALLAGEYMREGERWDEMKEAYEP
ncbi:hypothetical protein OIU84_017707 [Salix udensis]|uniref:Uncharacterized protein n=1 Tax=Salix udensis TaxID=889485 RepID=A0AAD6L432_9ROSI|nr:hypothetical protein OIU84_017707 [Salix udensis]